MNSAGLDLVVRHARVATASDCFESDIGIAGGRIVLLGQGLPPGAREIDARGRVVTPGGVDAHCHLDQPMMPPVRMADDFDTLPDDILDALKRKGKVTASDAHLLGLLRAALS